MIAKVELVWTSFAILVAIGFQYELATGRFPYPKWNSVFEQLTQVVQGPAPRLSDPRFSLNFINFVNTWWVERINDCTIDPLNCMSDNRIIRWITKSFLCHCFRHDNVLVCSISSLTKEDRHRPKYNKLLVSRRSDYFGLQLLKKESSRLRCVGYMEIKLYVVRYL